MLYDLHTHVLPGIDDGATDLSESLALLNQEKECGVSTVVLTPHFRAQVQKPQEFLARRAHAFETLSAGYQGEIQLVLGAEVLYSPYLASIENIRDFCIGDTNFLLVELPYQARMGDDVLRALTRLVDEHGILPILAHVERYEAVRRDVQVLQKFRSIGCLFQVNAATLAGKSFFLRRFVRALIRGGYVDLVGSDCHDPKNRPANVKEAYDELERLYGPGIVRDLLGNADMVLSNRY